MGTNVQVRRVGARGGGLALQGGICLLTVYFMK